MLIQRLKSHVSTFVLGALLLGVGGYEYKQFKVGQAIPSAQAKPKAEVAPGVLAEGRVAVPPGAGALRRPRHCSSPPATAFTASTTKDASPS